MGLDHYMHVYQMFENILYQKSQSIRQRLLLCLLEEVDLIQNVHQRKIKKRTLQSFQPVL